MKWLKRPSTRPFAGVSTHDPDGNMFDISQKDMTNRTSVYVENDGNANARHIDHVAFRTMNPEAMAEFYSYVFELAPGTDRKDGDQNHYLTDGHITLVIMPWDITDYDGTGIITQGMDHIGFRVETSQTLKRGQDRRRQSAHRAGAAGYRSRRQGACAIVHALLSFGQMHSPIATATSSTCMRDKARLCD